MDQQFPDGRRRTLLRMISLVLRAVTLVSAWVAINALMRRVAPLLPVGFWRSMALIIGLFLALGALLSTGQTERAIHDVTTKTHVKVVGTIVMLLSSLGGATLVFWSLH